MEDSRNSLSEIIVDDTNKNERFSSEVRMWNLVEELEKGQKPTQVLRMSQAFIIQKEDKK